MLTTQDCQDQMSDYTPNAARLIMQISGTAIVCPVHPMREHHALVLLCSKSRVLPFLTYLESDIGVAN